MELLKPTADSKTWAYPNQRNSLGLSPGPICKGGTCPGCTVGAGGCWDRPGGRKTAVCYVDGLLRARPGVKDALAYNTNLLRSADYERKVYLLLKEFLRFAKECHKAGVEPKYRLHWSGDVFNEEYAWALREAITDCYFITFWNYTRAFNVVPILLGPPNLRLYLSLDKVNFEAGLPIYQKYKSKGLCLSVMSEEKPKLPAGETCTACPVDVKRLPLEGACHKCRMCLSGKNIWFKTK